MAYFLAKTDPETYSIDDLIREKKTRWDGIKNPTALQAIRAMRPGDLVFVYHSQGQAMIVGLMKVISEPYVDPKKDVKKDPKNAKFLVVDMEFIRQYKEPITLKEIKETHLFDEWRLVYQGRLSTMRVPDEFVKWLKKKKVVVE